MNNIELGKDGKGIKYSDLPLKCPKCNNRVVKPSEFKSTRALNLYMIVSLIVALFSVMGMVLFEVVYLGVIKLYWSAISGVCVYGVMMIFKRNFNRYGSMVCKKCGWSQEYLIDLKGIGR